ncbi:energy-coupling factor transporter transmembrane component T family protein [Sporomusa termitida]|uniref:Energy-coupling factor transporter transmembrane protein EcfT n=1 Tax=Sporomusa termitida TaxID=2377 RepID=A0A517DP12_9FIRM|nr:energy-coupling factor transporter transmembrane component T [Sporomusa termitida]QDR79104.1 Energy-coupling factor transporter transmembrane protein EcfT [Sporomusa termitida]
MSVRDVWEATPGDTLVHKLDVRTKVVLLAGFAVAVILIDSPRTLYLLFCLTLALHILARSSVPRWRILIIFVLLGLWGSMVSQALFYSREPRTIVACLIPPSLPVLGTLTGGVFVYREGLEYGAVQALRSASMLSLGLLLSWTSDPRQLLKSFVSWRMPYELAFMLISGLRFLPVIFQETAVVLTAQRLRGFEPLKALVPRRLIQTAFQTLFPILARTLRRAATLAASVESRGFGREARVTEIKQWPASEQRLCLGVFTAIILLLGLKILDVLQFNGLFFIPAWRDLYDVMKVWM